MMLSPALEKYLMAIHTITLSKPVAKVKDVAAVLKVSSASVSPAMQRLESLHLIEYGRREYIELTHAGARHANSLQHRPWTNDSLGDI